MDFDVYIHCTALVCDHMSSKMYHQCHRSYQQTSSTAAAAATTTTTTITTTTTTRLCIVGRSKRREAGDTTTTPHPEQPDHVMQGPFIINDDNGGPVITRDGSIVSRIYRSSMSDCCSSSSSSQLCRICNTRSNRIQWHSQGGWTKFSCKCKFVQ